MTLCAECSKEFKQRSSRHKYCCEFCRNTAYVKRNPELVAKVKRKWDDANKITRSILARKHRENNPEAALLRAARTRAKREKLPFNLDLSDIVIPKCCPILYIDLEMNSGRPGGKANSPSLDKIVPQLGYVKGNVQVISFQANMMKSNATKEQLILFSNWIKETYE